MRLAVTPVRFALFFFLTACAVAPAQPKRIVSAAPSITEILYALGLGDRIVGVTTFCNYPEEATRKPKIGAFLNPNLEVVLSLKPDLFITGPGQSPSGHRLAAAGIEVLEVAHDTLPGIHQAIETIAKAAGVPDRAAALNRRIREDLEAIRKDTASRNPTPVAFIVGRTPGRLEGLVAVGRASYLNEVLEIAGGRNVFRDALSAYPKVNLEEMLARNPAVVIDMGEMAKTAGVTGQQKRAVVELWKRLPNLEAVKQNRVHAIASDVFVVPGPRVAQAAREFAALLHPESRR
jgi:iron complex transport system substrate-binding protein